MGDAAGSGTKRRTRAVAFLAVAALHLVAILGLIRAFGPPEWLSTYTIPRKLTAFTVTVTAPQPQPTPSPPPPASSAPAGAVGEAGRKAIPKPVAAPKPWLVITRKPAPAAASTGTADSSGARDAGAGTGAGGSGNGTGSGGAGTGTGAGGQRFIQIAGTIDSARDYPRESRDLRIGRSVVIVFTVGVDGRAHDCRVREPSGDPQADAITCRLAEARFRFRPSTDAAGNPVPASYGWRQRWFYPKPNP